MIKLEEERKRNAPPSVLELETKREKAKIKKNATFLMSEELDDVKTMNAFAAYAKTVTIRNMQLQEKQEIKRRAQDEERVKDIAMEVDRLKVVKVRLWRGVCTCKVDMSACDAACGTTRCTKTEKPSANAKWWKTAR